MDEQRQPDGSGPAETPVWRGNGARGSAGGAHARDEDAWPSAEHQWSPAEQARPAADPGRPAADRGWSGHEQGWSSTEQSWSSAGAALEPPAEPLALLTSAREPADQPTGPVAASHRYAPGLDDDTPVSGVPAVEPPLWREAARYSPSAGAGYGSPVAADHSAERVDPVDDEPEGLPQRVPAEPDVPVVSQEEPGARPPWTAPELAWIADQLRRTDFPQAPVERLDVDAVLEAVRGIAGVRSASVRPNPNGVHTLRLDLADDADPGQVSRVVAGLLEERMGLAAAPTAPPSQRHGKAEVPPPRAPASPPRQDRDTAAPRGEQPRRGWQEREPEPSPPPSRPAAAAGTAPVAGASPAAASARSAGTAGTAGVADPAGAASAAGTADPAGAADPARAAGTTPVAGAAGTTSDTDDEEPQVVSRPLPAPRPGSRVVIDQVLVSTFGLDATVEVQLLAGRRRARGRATGPAVDSYVMRLAAVSAANAVDELLYAAGPPEPVPELDTGASRCFVEHTGLVPFGRTEVAVVVLLLVCGGWVEQLTGSALVDNDPRQAMVRATLGAVNRRLEALLG